MKDSSQVTENPKDGQDPEGRWIHLDEVSYYLSDRISDVVDLSQYHKNMKLYYQWLLASQDICGRKVTEIQYWRKGRTTIKDFHHISLRTYIENDVGEKVLDGIYASYWPGVCASEFERKKNRPCNKNTDHFHELQTDKLIYEHEPEKIKLYTLDIDVINAIFYSITSIKLYWKQTGSVYVNPFARYSYRGIVEILALQDKNNPALLLDLCIALSNYSLNCTGIVKLLLDVAKVPAKLGFDDVEHCLGQFHEFHNINPPGIFAATPVGIFDLVKELSFLEDHFFMKKCIPLVSDIIKKKISALESNFFTKKEGRVLKMAFKRAILEKQSRIVLNLQDQFETINDFITFSGEQQKSILDVIIAKK